MVLTRWLILSTRQLKYLEFFWTLEFAETGRCIFVSYDDCLIVVCSLLDFVMGVTSAFVPFRRNRRNNGWLWTPAAPIFTSVLQSLSRSPRPYLLQTWRSSLGRRSPVCSMTCQTLSTRSSNLRWRSGNSGSRPWKGCRPATRRPSSVNSGLCR